MQKNNSLILKISTFILIVLASSSAYSGDHIYRPEHFISTPQIKRQTQQAIEKCRQFGVSPYSPEDIVYWSESPETDKQLLKENDINYLKKVQSEAKNAEARYYERQQQITAYQDQQEQQHRFRIAQQKARREEQQRQNGLRDLYYQRQAQLPDSPDSDIVTWEKDLPIRKNAPVACYDEAKISLKAPVEADITSNETSSDGSGGFCEDLPLTLSLGQHSWAADKENVNPQIQTGRQFLQKRERFAGTESTVRTQSTEKTEKTQITESTYSFSSGSSRIFIENDKIPKPYYSCTDTKSPARKKKPQNMPFSLIR